MVKKIIWIDDEYIQVAGEIMDLDNFGYSTVYKQHACDALDWFEQNPYEAGSSKQIVIDLLMPTRGDPRLMDSENKYPVGVRLCLALMKLENWDVLNEKIVLYSRSAMTNTYIKTQSFANESNILLLRKSASSRIAKELKDMGRI